MSIEEAVTHFGIKGKLMLIEPIKTGHINETFKSTWQVSGQTARYLHQRINHHVFPDVPALMQNMQIITSHLANKASYAFQPTQALELLKSDQGELFWRSASGEFWRTFFWLEDCEGFNICPDEEHAFAVGAAFGSFLRDLSVVSLDEIKDPIPYFQHVPRRLATLRAAITRDSLGRLKDVTDLVEFVESRTKTIGSIQNLLERKEIPERLVHADPKVNNVLFRKGTAQVVALVDLDTCMKGTTLYEVGDMLRSAGVVCDEDEADLGKVNVALPIAVQLISGYVTLTRELLTKGELAALPYSPQVIALSLGMRFLTDYLEGDTYFRIHYEGQNMRRARTQLTIAKRFEECEELLAAAVAKCADAS